MNEAQTFSTTPGGLSTRRVYRLVGDVLKIDVFYSGTMTYNAIPDMLEEGDDIKLPPLPWLTREPRRICYRVYVDGTLIATGVQRRGMPLKLKPSRGI